MKNKTAILSALTLVLCGGAAQAQTVQRLPLPDNSGVSGFKLTLAGGSYLGVQSENISNENFAKYKLSEPRGVGVTNVVKDSPASKAGLQKGDVITAFDGETVKSEGKLLRLISEVAPDQKARITVLRNGGEIELTATLGKRENTMFRPFGGGDGKGLVIPPSRDELNQLRVPPLTPPELELLQNRFPNSDNNFYAFGQTGRKLGVTVSPMSKQLADFFGASEDKGVLIDEVAENTPAAKAGLKAGDVILEIDGKAINNQADLVRAVNAKTEGEVTITILRDKQNQTLRATPESKK